MMPVTRSARLVSWGNGVLLGRVSPDDAADRVRADDLVHRVAAASDAVPAISPYDALDAPGGPGWHRAHPRSGTPARPGVPGPAADAGIGLGSGASPVSLPVAMARLRPLGVRGLRLALPVPGDPAGLPGPPAVTALAVAAGEAALTVGGPALAFVPAVEDYVGPLGRGLLVRWAVHPVTPAVPGGPGLGEAERALREALTEATAVLVAMDVARWRPELADALSHLRSDPGMAQALAPGYPQRAVAVLALARRVGGIAALAETSGDGAAVSAGEAVRRRAVLRDLGRVARQAQVAAYNAVLEPARG